MATKKNPAIVQDGKLPPQAIDIEVSVLGAVLMDATARDVVFSAIKNENVFYKESHSIIFAATQQMYFSDIPIDLLTAVQFLKKQGKLEAVGGPVYVSQLVNQVSNTTNTGYNCKILIEKFVLREIIRTSQEAIANAYNDSADSISLLDGVELSSNKIREVFSYGVNKPYEVTLNHKVSESRVVLELQGSPILTKGNVSLLISSPGTGKSQLTEIVLASHLRDDIDTLGFKVNSEKRVLLIDTERDHDDAFHGIKRIQKRTGVNGDKHGKLPDISFWSFRTVIGWKDKRMHLRKFMESKEYDLILLDGFSHFIGDTNNVEQSEEFVSELMSYSSTYRCGIMGTLHNNFKQKDSQSARGHLGGAMMREAYTYFSVTRDKDDPSLRLLSSKVGENVKNRGGKDNIEVYFKWSDELGMFVGADYKPEPAMTLRTEETLMTIKDVMRKIFSKHDYGQLSYGLLLQSYNKVSGGSESKSEHAIKKATRGGVIIKKGRGVYEFDRGEEAPF